METEESTLSKQARLPEQQHCGLSGRSFHADFVFRTGWNTPALRSTLWRSLRGCEMRRILESEIGLLVTVLRRP
jgi:hypothetical protein